MLMLLLIIWLGMVMICFLHIVLGILIGVRRILVVGVRSGVRVLRIRIGKLLGKDLVWRLLVYHMDLMISIVQDPSILGPTASS